MVLTESLCFPERLHVSGVIELAVELDGIGLTRVSLKNVSNKFFAPYVLRSGSILHATGGLDAAGVLTLTRDSPPPPRPGGAGGTSCTTEAIRSRTCAGHRDGPIRPWKRHVQPPPRPTAGRPRRGFGHGGGGARCRGRWRTQTPTGWMRGAHLVALTTDGDSAASQLRQDFAIVVGAAAWLVTPKTKYCLATNTALRREGAAMLHAPAPILSYILDSSWLEREACFGDEYIVWHVGRNIPTPTTKKRSWYPGDSSLIVVVASGGCSCRYPRQRRGTTSPNKVSWSAGAPERTPSTHAATKWLVRTSCEREVAGGTPSPPSDPQPTFGLVNTHKLFYQMPAQGSPKTNYYTNIIFPIEVDRWTLCMEAHPRVYHRSWWRIRPDRGRSSTRMRPPKATPRMSSWLSVA